MNDFKTIIDLKPTDFLGKRVLVRVDFNVSLENGQVIDDFRIKGSLPTIKFLQESGAKVILISHMASSGDTLKPVALHLNKTLPIIFSNKVLDFEAVRDLNNSEVLLLENLRQHEGEISNSEAFARELASLGDIYINEAFSASHRAHASIVGVSKLLPSYAGLLFIEEYENLSKVFNASKPFLVILGGAKFSTKLPVIKKLAPLADNIFLGGALVHVLWRKMGYEMGRSLVDNSIKDLDEILKLKNVHLPQDVVVAGVNDDKLNKLPEQVGSQDVISDAGPQTVETIIKAIKEAQFIFWNGPLGFIEKGFMDSSQKIVTAIGESSAYSIVGGGDTVAVVNALKAVANFDFVSTSGGASLEFIASGTLVGIEALKNQ